MKKQNDLELFNLNDKCKLILNNQMISDDNPGSILVDFHMILDFIGEKGLKTGGKHGFFPMAKLAEINSKLTNSMQLSSQRPQQKSFPHIHGLYLLLRSTGIAYLKIIDKKSHLFLDETILQSWNKLNFTEQYFTLLEAWLIHGNEQIILEHNRGFPDHVDGCYRFLSRFNEVNVYKTHKGQTEFTYTPGWYNVALLQMFGFIIIESPKKEIEKFWLINQIKCTDLGSVMIPLLYANIIENELVYDIMDGKEVSFGELQSVLLAFFPEWKNNLTMVEPGFQEGLYVFKISIGSVWRRISISGDQELEQLSDAILEAFDFDKDHMYEFEYKNRKGVSVRVFSADSDEPPLTTEVLVGELNLNIGDSLTYLFDYGDNWKFSLILEKIDGDNIKISTPILLESYGESPEQYEYGY